MTRLAEKESQIAANLDEIQKLLHVSQTLPEEAGAFGAINTNLAHKERELNQNQNTMQFLGQGEIYKLKLFLKNDSSTYDTETYV